MTSQNRRLLVFSALDLWNYGPRWEVYSRFANEGYDVDYISPFSGGSGNGKISKIHISVPFSKYLHGRLLNYFLFMILSFIKAVKLIKQHRPDVVYGHEIFGVPQGYVLSKLYGIPLLLRFQGNLLYRHLGKRSVLPFMHHVSAFKTPANYAIITNDGTSGDKVAESLRVPKKRVKFWYNGICKCTEQTIPSSVIKRKYSIPPTAKIIISVCRLATIKGVHRLIEAAHVVLHDNQNVYFMIVGEGTEKQNLINLAKKLGVSDHIIFTGHVDHADIHSYLAIADIYVNLQDDSCLGATLMDAMISGRCIVALNTGETYKVIKNNVTGILINPAELSFSLPNILINLLKNESLRKKLGAQTKAFASEQFWTWDERAQAEIDLVDSLIGSVA